MSIWRRTLAASRTFSKHEHAHKNKTMLSSETIAAPPPTSPQQQQQQQDDESLYGPVTKAASKEAERNEIRKAEERQHAHSPLNVKEKMKIETAQVLAAAATASPQKQQKKKRQAKSGGNSSQLPPPSTPPQAKMSSAAAAAADAKNNKTKNQNNNTQKPPLSGNRGIARGKYTPAQAKQLADAWGRDDTSDEYDYEDDDDGSYYYDYDEGEEEPPYYSNDNNATEEEMFHYQHHRVSAYSNRYGRGHGRSPPRSGNDDGNNNNNNNNNNQGSGGIFSIASNWLQNQREKLHQMELERKVEEQRRKLVEEGRKQRELEAEKRRDRGYAISPPGSPTKGVVNSAVASCAITGDEVATTSMYMNGCCNSEEEASPQQLKTVNSNNSSLFICGFGGNYAINTVDDASDYSGVARIDSSGNVVEMMPSADLEDDYDEEEEGDYMTVRTPKITVTGKGMSIAVEILQSNSLLYDDPLYIKIVPEPRRDENSVAPFILLQPQMKALLKSGGLPQSLNYCKWKRLYSLSRDGDSFETFLRMVGGHDRTVLVVKTTAGRLFGGYAETRWEARHKNRQADGFYGSAQACLFRFPHCGGNGDLIDEDTSSSAALSSDDEVVIYKWTGANRYIQLCDAAKRTVAFGGGGDDGDFGLCIEDDFRRGTTGHCSTFENEALCEEGYFDVVDLEVWGFTLDF
jgi:hypothetical protein